MTTLTAAQITIATNERAETFTHHKYTATQVSLKHR